MAKWLVALVGVWLGVFLVLAPAEGSADPRTEQLEELLEHSDSYRVRLVSATSLGRIGGVYAVPALVRALDDRHAAVRAAAAHSLGRIGAVDAIPPLERLIEGGGQPTEVVAQAREAIQRIRETQQHASL